MREKRIIPQEGFSQNLKILKNSQRERSQTKFGF
jgi:hypothetical protein